MLSIQQVRANFSETAQSREFTFDREAASSTAKQAIHAKALQARRLRSSL
jgi:hypothetical protein